MFRSSFSIIHYILIAQFDNNIIALKLVRCLESLLFVLVTVTNIKILEFFQQVKHKNINVKEKTEKHNIKRKSLV